MPVVKATEATPVRSVSRGRWEQLVSLAQVEIVDRLVQLDLLDFLDSLVSLHADLLYSVP